MIHELTRFLLNRQIYNEYAHYDLKHLIEPDRVVRQIHKVIKELHEGASSEGGTASDKDLSVQEVETLSQDGAGIHKNLDELKSFLQAVEKVDLAKYSPESIKRIFHAAYQKNLAAYLVSTSIPVLNGVESLPLEDVLAKLEDGNTKLYQPSDIVDYATYTERPAEALKTIPTYIKPLDDVIDGGTSPGQLSTYVGWPGIGKTLLLHQSAALAYHAGHHAAIITLEINKEEACRRLDKLFSRRDTVKFKELHAQAKEKGGKLTILDATDDVFTPQSVRSFLESSRRKGCMVDILFIDYADLMETGRGLEDYNELGEIYRQLRRLANRFDIPIWTASQAIRGAINKRWLGMGDIADSFKKARIADLIVTINQTEEEQELGHLRLYVAKSRRNKGHPRVHLTTDLDRMCVLPNGRTEIV